MSQTFFPQAASVWCFVPATRKAVDALAQTALSPQKAATCPIPCFLASTEDHDYVLSGILRLLYQFEGGAGGWSRLRYT